jgi:hypothetical protein
VTREKVKWGSVYSKKWYTRKMFTANVTWGVCTRSNDQREKVIWGKRSQFKKYIKKKLNNDKNKTKLRMSR